MYGFISLFPILPHHPNYHETIDETTPTMQDFNFGVSYVLIAFNCKTRNDLYVGFHLDETLSIFLFFKLLPIIQIAYVTSYLMYMKYCESFYWN